MTSHCDTPDAQREHWQATFEANPDMYGTDPSQSGGYAAELFNREHVREPCQSRRG